MCVKLRSLARRWACASKSQRYVVPTKVSSSNIQETHFSNRRGPNNEDVHSLFSHFNAICVEKGGAVVVVANVVVSGDVDLSEEVDFEANRSPC